MAFPVNALKLGLQLIQEKLGMATDPSFYLQGEAPVVAEKPARDRTAKISPPRLINPG